MNYPLIKDKDYVGINGVSINQLIHPHFEIWQRFFKENYILNDNIKIILFLPCAAVKPYFNSPIHCCFNKIIDNYDNVQKIVVSNAGVIPYEFCDKYPFNSYDWNPLFETPEIKEKYIEITSKRIYDFFKAKELKKSIKYISYLRNDSESIKAIKKAFKKLNINLIIIKISGELHETADLDLLLIYKENLIKLEDKLKRNLS